MKNIFIIYLLLTCYTIHAQRPSQEEIRDKGIKRIRIYKIDDGKNEYNKPFYKRDELLYEYTYDTSGREIVSYHYYEGLAGSLAYRTHIDKDSIFAFDSLDRPLLVKTSRIDIANDVGHYRLSKLVLTQKYRYDDVLDIEEIRSYYENKKTAYVEFSYRTILSPTYKTGYEKYDGKKKLLEQDIKEYDSTHKMIRSIKYERGNPSPVIVPVDTAVNVDTKLSVIDESLLEIQDSTPVVKEVIPIKKQQSFSFKCNYKDSVQLKIKVEDYYRSYLSTGESNGFVLHVSCYQNNRLYERKDVILSAVPDTNDLTGNFIKKLVFCTGNEENVIEIRKYDNDENLKLILKNRWNEDYYNAIFEYDFYDESQKDKNPDYQDLRKNGNGKVILYEQGKKSREATYENYQLHGTTTIWRPNGNLSSVSEYSEDLLNGTSMTYDTSGKATEKEFYKDGVPSGITELIGEERSKSRSLFQFFYYSIVKRIGKGNIIAVSKPFHYPLKGSEKKEIQRMRRHKKEYLDNVIR